MMAVPDGTHSSWEEYYVVRCDYFVFAADVSGDGGVWDDEVCDASFDGEFGLGCFGEGERMEGLEFVWADGDYI